jgi:hypothetical protein
MCSPAPIRHSAHPRWLVYAVACLLLTIFAALCLRSAHESSITFDEPEQVAVGYASLTRPGHGCSVINLRLSQVLQAMPLLAFDPPPRWPTEKEQLDNYPRNISYGRLLFFSGGRDAQQMIFASRTVSVALGLALGAVIFWCSRRLHGDAAGLLSLALYVFSPLVVAHSSLATTEIATALFFTLATLALWRLLGRPTALNVILAGTATGALAATKISGLLIVPIIAVLLVAKIAGRDEKPHIWRARSLALLGAAVVAWAVLWAIYGGPSAATAAGATEWATHPTVAERLAPKMIGLARDWRVLPDAYLFDLHQFVHSGEIRRAYLLGQYSLDGWWYFFPVAWLVKNTLPFLVAAPLAAMAAWKMRRTNPSEGGPEWRALAPFAALALIYGCFAIAGNLNIGARHLLPLFPPFLIFAGLAARAMPAKRKLGPAVAVALAAGAAIETVAAHPHHLSYFNLLAGGSNNGRHVMVDSSSDWGESLIAVRRWLDRREAEAGEGSPPPRVFMSCFANADFAYYGLGEGRVVHLPQYYDNRPIRPRTLAPGTYVISATMLTCVYNGRVMGPWRPVYEALYHERLKDMAELQPYLKSQADLNALMARDGAERWLSRISDFDYLRFSRLCAYLRKRGPDANITPGMLVFELTLQDLETALAGPPPELHPDGAIKGADRFADEDIDFIK